MLYPMILNPVYKEYIWGGNKLKTKYGKDSIQDTIAESWELSCHKDGISVIANGEYTGEYLDTYLKENGSAVLGSNCRQDGLPLLVKFIDAADSLSIQVHPDDAFAAKCENSNGKREMWYVMDCSPEAALFYGFNRSLSKDEFASRAKDGTITEVLKLVPVKPGDVFFIDSGTVHAIGKGMTIAEIGNNCNITYRIFDFFRKDKDGNPRELHLDKAAEVASLTVSETYTFDEQGILDCKDFLVQEIKLCGEIDLCADEKSFHNLLCLDGNCILSYSGQNIEIQKGTSVFLPAGMGEYILSGRALVLKTTV